MAGVQAGRHPAPATHAEPGTVCQGSAPASKPREGALPTHFRNSLSKNKNKLKKKKKKKRSRKEKSEKRVGKKKSWSEKNNI